MTIIIKLWPKKFVIFVCAFLSLTQKIFLILKVANVFTNNGN